MADDGFVPDPPPEQQAENGFVPDNPPPAEPDTSAVKSYVAKNLDTHEKSKREPIDMAKKPVPAEGFMDQLAAMWATSVVGLKQSGETPTIGPNEHLGRMTRIAGELFHMAGDAPAMAAGFLAGAGAGAPIGGMIGTAVGPIGTLGGIGAGAMIGGMAGANAAPAGIRKHLMDQYEEAEGLKDPGTFMDHMAAASWEAAKAGTVGALTGGMGWAAGVAAIGAKPLTTGAAQFVAELSTMATASAAMEKRLPNREDFINSGIILGGMHIVPKLYGIYKATGESPAEIVEETKSNPVLDQELKTTNPDLPKIEVPSEEDQAKLGLSPLTEEDLKNEDGTTNPPPSPTEHEHQAREALEVAKEARADQLPPEEKEPADPPVSDKLSEDKKYLLNFVGAQEPKADTSVIGAIKRDLVKLWRTEDTAGNGEPYESEFAAKVSDEMANVYSKTFDFPRMLGRMMNKIGKAPEIENNPEVLATLHSEHMTIVGNDFLNDRTIDFHTKEKTGEGYQTIVDDYHKAFPDDPMMDNLRAHILAARIVELAKRGKKIIVNTGTDAEGEEVSAERAQKVLDEDDGTLALFNQRRINYRNRVLKYAHDSGYWTEKEFNAMIDSGEQYASLHRIQELDPLIGKSGGGRGVFRLKGVGNLIVDPIVSDYKDTVMLVRMAEENRVNRSVVENLATGHDDAFLRRVEPDMKIVNVKKEELSKELTKQDIDHDEDSLNAMSVFRAERARNGPNRMEIHVDGERQVYEGDPDTIAISNALRGNPPVASMVSKVLSTAAAGIRAGTINAWSFVTKHAFRNQLTAATYSEHGLKPFIDPVMNALPGNNEEMRNFYSSGGAQSSYLAYDDAYIQSKIFKIDKEASFMDKVFNKFQTAVQMSHALILTNDNALRFAEFKRAREGGAGMTEAAWAARRVLPGVQTQGIARSWWLAQTAFLGIHVRSMVRQGEAVGDQIEQSRQALNEGRIADSMKGPMARAAAYISVPAATAAAYNYLSGNQDRIDRLLPWQKNGFFNWCFDSWDKATPEEAAAMPHEDLKRQGADGQWEINNGVTGKIQMPFTQGIFFGGLVQASIDAYRQHSLSAYGDWAKQVGESVLPSLMPNFYQPIHAQMTNYNEFTGQHLIPDNLLRLAPELQTMPWTTDSAKAIGRMIGHTSAGALGPEGQKLASPIVVEEYVRDWTGPIGMGILKSIDWANRKLDSMEGKKAIEPPEGEWAETPFVGAFVWRNSTMKTSNIDEFTTRYNKAVSNNLSVKEYGKRDKNEDADRFAQEHDTEMFKATEQATAIKNMKHAIHGINVNEDYSPTDKTQLIQRIYYQMDETAKVGVQQMNSVKSQVEDAKKAKGGGQ